MTATGDAICCSWLFRFPLIPNRPMDQAERAVLVTTAHRGVFFGYSTDTSGETIKLRAARCCVRWTRDVKGFLGLAATGPSDSCRVGPPADIELRGITSVSEVTPVAVVQWEKAPWT